MIQMGAMTHIAASQFKHDNWHYKD